MGLLRPLPAHQNAAARFAFGMGNKDFLFETGVKLMELYDEVGLPYEYLENEGTHDWNSWRMYLVILAPKFFK